jgi:hypothetical protein
MRLTRIVKIGDLSGVADITSDFLCNAPEWRVQEMILKVQPGDDYG